MNQFCLDYALVTAVRSRFDWLLEPDPWCRGDCRLMTLAFLYAHRTRSNPRRARTIF